MTGLLVDCKVLADVDMHVANALYSKVLEYGQELHLQGMRVTRHRERFRFLVQAIATMRAIDTVFDFNPVDVLNSDDDPISRVRGKQFQFEHLLELEKHMFAKVEDCVFAFGLLNHQYEDPIEYMVLEAIRLYLFDDLPVNDDAKMKNIEDRSFHRHSTAPLQPPPSDPSSEEPNARRLFSTSGVSVWQGFASISVNAKNRPGESKSDELMSLSEHLLKKMVRKPQRSEVHSVLMRIADETVDGGQPALTYSQNHFTIAVKVLRANTTNKLKNILATVLNHKGAEPAEYLYGKMREGSPFFFESVVVDPSADAKPLKLQRNDYCDPKIKSFMEQDKPDIETASMSNTPCQYLTISLDQYGYEERLKTLGMPPEVASHNPPSHPGNYRAFSETSTFATVYPTSFAQSEPVKYREHMNFLQKDTSGLDWKNLRGDVFTDAYALNGAHSSNNLPDVLPFHLQSKDDMVDYDCEPDCDTPNRPVDPSLCRIASMIAHMNKDRLAL